MVNVPHRNTSDGLTSIWWQLWIDVFEGAVYLKSPPVEDVQLQLKGHEGMGSPSLQLASHIFPAKTWTSGCVLSVLYRESIQQPLPQTHFFLCHKMLSFRYVIIWENMNQTLKSLCLILLFGVITFCHVRLCYLFRFKPQPGPVYNLLGWCNGFWAQIIQKCVGIKGFASTECTWEYWPLQAHLLKHTLLPLVTMEMEFTHTDRP